MKNLHGSNSNGRNSNNRGGVQEDIEIHERGRGKEWFVCDVVRIFKDKGFGFAVYRNSEVMFHARQGMVVEAGLENPEFRPPTGDVDAPFVGDRIIVMVEEKNGRYHAKAWAPFKSYTTVRAAMDDSIIRRTPQPPKPAPALPKTQQNPKTDPTSKSVVVAEPVAKPLEPIVVPVVPHTHGAQRKARRTPFVTGPAFVPTASKQQASDKPGSMIPFEHDVPSQEGVGFLSQAVESAKARHA